MAAVLPTQEQYKKWSLPSKYTAWGFILTLIGTPGVIIGYYDLWGKDQLSKSVLKALTASMQIEVQLRSAKIMNIAGEGECLALVVENLSTYTARNVVLEYRRDATLQKWSFQTPLLNDANRGLFARSVSELPVAPIGEVLKSVTKHPMEKFIGVSSTPSQEDGLHIPFEVRISFMTPADQKVQVSYTVWATFRE